MRLLPGLALALALHGPGARAADAETPPRGQLPRDVVPTHYALSLTIVPDSERFSGDVTITVTIGAALDFIWMHGKDLEVESAEFIDQNGRLIAARFAQVTPDGVAKLTLAERVPPQFAGIRIRYQAPFNRQLEGLYRVDENGASYAFTQFEAVSARLAFPGFDEPVFKTPFAIDLTTRAEYGAFANTTQIRTETLDGGMKRVFYTLTEKLPTYLIAFAVGPLDVVEWEPVPASRIRPRALPLRGLAARGKGDQLRYALAKTAGILGTLESYFGIAYPFDKLDLVAAPDFAAGAMENAGMIVYRESLLLLDDDAPLSQQRRFASVHAHELAHQWFGNLVTMPWWDDIWLNEAFATWMAYKTVHAWKPDYLFDRVGQERALGAMATDSLRTTRRIREPVSDVHDIENAFDGITYSKGGGVLAMFETYLGEAVFRDGVRRHMLAHAFGTATVFDFIASLSAAAGAEKNVSGAFRSFLFQPGVPLIDLELDCGGGQAELSLAQSRYLPLGSAADPKRRWELPVCVSFGVDKQLRERCFMLDQPRQTFALGSALTCPDWIMPNRNGTGYYRWALPQAQWARLRRVVNTRLNAREKIAFADSLVASFTNGSLPGASLLEAIPELAAATERPVVTAPLKILKQITDQLLDPQNRPRALAWARQVYGRRLAQLETGSGAESAAEGRLLRAELIEFLAAEAGSKALRAELLAQAKAYLGYGGDGQVHPAALDLELLDVAMIVAAEQADAPLYEHLLEHLRHSTSALLRRALLGGLGRVRDPRLLDRSLALVMDPSLRINELPTLLNSLLHHDNRDATWRWIQENSGALIERIPPTYRRSLPRVGEEFCATDRAAELRALFEPHLEHMPGAPRTLEQTVEKIALCAALKARQGPGLNRYLAELDLAAD